MSATMKSRLARWVDWVDHHRLVPIFIAGVLVALCLIVVFMSWLIGYYGNALYGTKFDLSSCWQGISLGITGTGGVMSAAFTAWKMYDTDSKFNSEQGKGREKP